jgi:hypothetical protein
MTTENEDEGQKILNEEAREEVERDEIESELADEVGSTLMPWEEEADHAVKYLLDNAVWDFEKKTVTIVDGEDHRGNPVATTYSKLEDLTDSLETEYTQAWLNTVPFESGSPQVECDAQGAVGDFLMKHEENFTKLGWEI